MEYVTKHRITGKDIYKNDNKYFYLENENFIKMEELTVEQSNMIKALTSEEATVIHII